MSKEILSRVKDTIDNLIDTKYQDATVDTRRLFYANGNDGTDFDWECNGHTCELGYGCQDSECWTFKSYIDTEGTLEICCFPHGEMQPVEVVKNKNFVSPYQAECFMSFMVWNFDMKDKYDVFVDEVVEC